MTECLNAYIKRITLHSMSKINQLREIPIESLVRSSFQPRRHFNDEKLQELAEAIKTTNGLLQPIVVRPIAQGKFEIIAGERRWRAAMLANLETVSCIIRPATDQEAFEAAIIENVSRTDLNPIEEAQAYQRLMNDFGYIHEEIAAAVGKSRASITNALRMLKLDSRIQQFIIDGLLSEGHGKTLAGLPLNQQYELGQQCAKSGWSVRKTEQAVRKMLAQPTHHHDRDVNIIALERSLSEHIGCQVKIAYENKQGKLEINFHNLEVLQGLLAKMGYDKEEI